MQGESAEVSARRGDIKNKLMPALEKFYGKEPGELSEDFILYPIDGFMPFDELALYIFYRPINVADKTNLSVSKFIDLLLSKGF